MNNKFSTVIAGAVIAALIVAAASLGAVLARPTPIAAAQGGGVVRQITVVGSGEAKAAPDRATIQLGVMSEAATVQEALKDNNAKMATLIDQLKQLGVAERDIQTSNFNINATYGENGRTVTGYQVSNTVAVTIRKLSEAGSMLDKVVSAGANQVYGIGFGIEDPKQLQEQARNAAIADAQTRAQAIARAANSTVGQVISISETIGQPPMPLFDRGMAAEAQAAAGGPPIQAGEQVVTAQVQITYELR
jgi:uncharacterized protein YggE